MPRRCVALAPIVVTLMVVTVMVVTAIAVAATAAGATSRAVKSPCRLVTRAEIAQVRPGVTVGRAQRDVRVCRWEFDEPAALAGQVAATTTLVRNAGSGVFDDAVKVDEQLQVPVEDVTGLGRRAVYEPTKANVIVLTKRGNIFEVQLLGYNGITPDDVKAQVVALAKLALPRL